MKRNELVGNNFPFAAKRIPSEPRCRTCVKIIYTPPKKIFVQQITYSTGFLPPVLFDFNFHDFWRTQPYNDFCNL